jgi:putative DNA primase/helicase
VSTPTPQFQADLTYKLVPAELKSRNIWMIFEITWNEAKGKFDKKPMNPLTQAGANDPSTGISFEQAFSALTEWNKAQRKYVLGVYIEPSGSVMTPDLVGIDLDKCCEDKSSTYDVSEQAAEVISKLDTYTEVSVSGTGIHCFVLGEKPGTHCRRGNIEIYSAARAITVSGISLTEQPLDVRECDITWLYDKMVAGDFESEEIKTAKREGKTSFSGGIKFTCVPGSVTTKLQVQMTGRIVSEPEPFILEDEAGNTVESKSHSEMDLSACTGLALKHGDNTEAIDSEFRQSALYRPKWERNDYRETAIAKGIETAQRIKTEIAEREAAAPQNIPMVSAADSPEVTTPNEAQIAKPEDEIPPFDPSVINGFYAKFVEVVTRGTTLAPQFAFAIAKTIVGIRMSGKVRFENLDVEPRYYAALIGETGSGKGEAWRRALRILQPEGAVTVDSRIKIIDSADSGAGLKDLFFEPPTEWPVLCFVDEVADLGNKSKDTRNPAILDTIISMADSTTISRTLSKRSGGSKSMNGARLAIVMCGQDGSVYMKSFAGRTKLGLWDRFYPEYGVPQETGDLPPIDIKDALKLLTELNSLDYSGTMKMGAEAKAILSAFWDGQPVNVRRKARWKKNLQIDAFMSAFGRGLRTVDAEDMQIAIRIFTRQLVIREVCFTSEVPDKTGYYLSLIKGIWERMRKQINDGVPLENVALARRDFETRTHAFRDNEIHYFKAAWEVFAPTYLARVEVKKANGHSYVMGLSP